MSEWRIFNGREYEKRWYTVRVAGATYFDCWPNAGMLMSTDGSGKEWPPFSCEFKEQEKPE